LYQEYFYDIIHDVQDALFGQLTYEYGITILWTAMLGIRSPVHKYQLHLPCLQKTITLILCSVGQICLQGLQVQQVTLAGICQKYSQFYFLVVSTAGQLLAVVYMAMLSSLVSKVLRPTKQKNVELLV
jgi:hypothetical protein